MQVEEQVMMIKGAGEGMLDTVPVSQVTEYQTEFLAFMATEYAEVGKEIREKKEFSADAEAKFKEAIKRFVVNFKAKHKV